MNWFKSLFIAISAAYLITDSLGLEDIGYFLKPAIISSLLVYYFNVTHGKYSALVVMALLFSISGDFWLMFSGESYFIVGLGSFLLAHFFYILVFRKLGAFKHFKISNSAPFVTIFVLMMLYLRSDLGNLKIPVTVYAFTIIFMSYSALSLKSITEKRAFIILFIGTLLFVVSDSLIAIQKFKSEDISASNLHFLIMSSYIVAQYLIIEGIIKITLNRRLNQ